MPPSEKSSAAHDAWIQLPGGGNFILTGDCHFGRIEGNEIVNPDSRISRRHSVVQREGTHFVLVDLGSTNGTFLNESRIYKPTRLKDGDEIMVGSLRYIFCQPTEAAEPANDDSAVGRTVVAVAKVSCWLLLVALPEDAGPAGDTWSETARRTLTAGGAGVRRLRAATFFAHWRDRKVSPEKVRGLILALGRQPRPPGVRVALHHGAVRVGPSANSTEENLLGADVTFTHKLEAATAELGISFVASEPAVVSLGLAAEVRALGPQTVRDLPGTHLLFSL
jgi:hypothetical protein